MLSYVYQCLLDTVNFTKNIYPFLLGDGIDGMFKGSLFFLLVAYSIIEVLLDYFNGENSGSDENSDSKSK